MINIAYKLGSAFFGSVLTSSIGAVGGSLTGFVYARLADLPVDQSVKAWAVWNAADCALQGFIHLAFIDNPIARGLTKATFLTVMTALGIQELQKRNLIGEKMRMFIIAFRVLSVAQELVSAFFCATPSPDKA